ncbi:RNA-binding protein MEX3B [Elysia marginata]|uniref:RNA-binding protein MEX3B n=1 Tax=Elysia marginata TaxID=1093978 RepID=A0AAV4H0L9_9GAST|nr:RNA-binding protein MEX3B [Elysia marginata]
MNRNKEVGGFFSSGNSSSCGVSNNISTNGGSTNNFFCCNEEPLDINVRNLENLTLMDNFGSMTSTLSGLENNENLVYFQDFDSVLNPYIDDPKEGNISRTVRVPSSEHVAEIVGRQGCKIKDLRARTNTYIKTPMRTQSPVFVVTGKEEAVLHVMEEIQNAAEHFTHIRASRNQHKSLGGGLGGSGGLEANKPASREGDVMIQVTVPYRVVGLVVGLKGQTIKAIQQDTDTFIVTPNRDKAPIFEIRGQPENVERAKSMILRHIETRTRHCRLQDSTNLPSTWSSGIDETTRGGSSGSTGGIGDFSMFQHHHSGSSSNNESIGSSINSHSHGSMSLANANGTFNGNPSFAGNGGSLGSNHFSPSYASSNSPPVNGNYSNWGSYSGMFDHHPHHCNQLQHQQQNTGGPMTTWSSASNDFAPTGSNGISTANDPGSFCNGSSHQGLHSSQRSSHHRNLTNVNVGSMSSSNSSASISPPHDFISEGPYSSSHHGMMPFCPPMGTSPPLHGLLHENAAEAGDFSNFPLLSAGSSSPGSTKGSLVLGNLFRSSNSGASSSTGLPMMSSSSSSSNSSSNSTASPTSTDGFHRGDDQLGLLSGAGFAAGGSSTSAPVNSLGASSSSTSSSSSSYPLVADTAMFAGASGSGIQLMLRDSSGGADGGNGVCSRLLSGDSSPTSKTSPPSMNEGSCSQSSPTPRLCRVCEEFEVVAALVPCGHNLFCMECAERIISRPAEEDRKCPVCKETASGVLRIRA